MTGVKHPGYKFIYKVLLFCNGFYQGIRLKVKRKSLIQKESINNILFQIIYPLYIHIYQLFIE
jgi:hypothetical protein